MTATFDKEDTTVKNKKVEADVVSCTRNSAHAQFALPQLHACVVIRMLRRFAHVHNQAHTYSPTHSFARTCYRHAPTGARAVLRMDRFTRD